MLHHPTDIDRSYAEALVSRILMVIGWVQGNCRHLQQIVAAERLAMRNGELIEGRKCVADQAGHGAEDESVAAIAVGAHEVDDAPTSPARSRWTISSAVLAASVSSACKSLAMLSSQVSAHLPHFPQNATYATPLVTGVGTLARDPFPAAIQAQECLTRRGPVATVFAGDTIFRG